MPRSDQDLSAGPVDPPAPASSSASALAAPRLASENPTADKLPMSASEETNWCYAAHLGSLLMIFASGGLAAFLVPLAIWLMKKDESERIAEHARAALNFQVAAVAATFLLIVIGFGTLGFGFLLTIPGLLVVYFLQIFGGVRACYQVSKDLPARYPFSINVIK